MAGAPSASERPHWSTLRPARRTCPAPPLRGELRRPAQSTIRARRMVLIVGSSVNKDGGVERGECCRNVGNVMGITGGSTCHGGLLDARSRRGRVSGQIPSCEGVRVVTRAVGDQASNRPAHAQTGAARRDRVVHTVRCQVGLSQHGGAVDRNRVQAVQSVARSRWLSVSKGYNSLVH